MRTQKVQVDIMKGDKYYTTYKGVVPLHPEMQSDGRCKWVTRHDEIEAAVLSKFQSLRGKEFQLFVC